MSRQNKIIRWLVRFDDYDLVVFKYEGSDQLCSAYVKNFKCDFFGKILFVTDGKTQTYPDPAIFEYDQPEPKDKALQEYIGKLYICNDSTELAAWQEINDRLKAIEAANEKA